MPTYSRFNIIDVSKYMTQSSIQYYDKWINQPVLVLSNTVFAGHLKQMSASFVMRPAPSRYSITPPQDIFISLLFNSLWPSDAIWQQGSRSTLVQVMSCCLTAPSHYLNQCWLMISEVLRHSLDNNFPTILKIFIIEMSLKFTNLRL